MTFLTLGAKWPGRGLNGLAGSNLMVGAGAATPSRAKSSLSAIAPRPTPHCPKKWRRVCDFRLQISDIWLESSCIAFGTLSGIPRGEFPPPLLAGDEVVGVKDGAASENQCSRGGWLCGFA